MLNDSICHLVLCMGSIPSRVNIEHIQKKIFQHCLKFECFMIGPVLVVL